ncbi:SDR family NAD(P)-dependent oxidoreductase [Ramlibacter ginsenosidimutans]|uniref:SDR family NAD(P)-dependent oxidoreductase n=1 Tax=Ramlibacter ginsenosidimutans TaxID=502333 RepID=A0A934TRJ3_9BURK|nr:SDR family NAD(P)-dependent oxidoreductase [Ramlibacter ginsenosidimutans]MBK6005422.1 SDR family NAD(P)-dependent oxidoreductase [Ramlibacter ginsenosidimutans]
MRDFQGKVAAITGAGSGIGRALALALARAGARLALSDIDAAGLALTAQQVVAVHAPCTTASLDVSQREAVFAWADECRNAHGQVNLIVNNAGVALAAGAATVRIEDFQWIMGINFWGVVHGTQAFLPHLQASGDGHIVNISSIAGMVALPTQAAYNATKFAVRGYTEALRMELELAGAPVSATCVHPGGIATRIARSMRIDPAWLRSTGLGAEALRERSDQMLQVTTPDQAAQRILQGVRRNERRVLVGPDARALDVMQRVLGAGYQPLLVRRWRRMAAGR